MLVQESYENGTEGYVFGESDKFEPWTQDTGKLFRDFQKEYGRCAGKVYRDRGDETLHVGWVFERMTKYEDSDAKYLRRVWVTLFDREDEVKRTQFPHVLSVA